VVLHFTDCLSFINVPGFISAEKVERLMYMLQPVIKEKVIQLQSTNARCR
jgi:hypothetical protein